MESDVALNKSKKPIAFTKQQQLIDKVISIF